MKVIMKRLAIVSAMAAMTLVTSVVAQAKTQVVWWDFLSGGDGVRMKAIIQAFQKDNPDIEHRRHHARVGCSVLHQGADLGRDRPGARHHDLSSVAPAARRLDRRAAAVRGCRPQERRPRRRADYFPSDWDAAHVDGKLYAVPLDIHSLVLYYNKDLLKKAGLLGDDGKPKGLDGLDNFNAALKKLTDPATGQYGASFHDGQPDGSSIWRIFYTLLAQQGGDFLKDGKVLDGDNLAKAKTALAAEANWVAQGWAPKNTSYPASIALFTSGKAAMHINGVWEVPTMVDLAKQNKLGFEWGAVQIPVLFDHPATWADSHAFAIPNRKGNEISPEKLKAVMTIIAWVNKHSLSWATAGHIPAYKPVDDSPEFITMKPNADYASLAKTATFDPKSIVTGVASPAYDAATNFLEPAVNGQMEAGAAVEQMRDELQNALQ